MIVVIISLAYTLITTFGVGALTICGLNRCLGRRDYSAIAYIISGIVTITVYVELFSLFTKIGALAHILMLVLSACGYFLAKDTVRECVIPKLKSLISWEGFFYLGFIVFIAFFVSRGDFHTDTNIYHASAIRLYEEYGIIKGAGNLQLHYAYNSSSLAYAAIYSLNWLFGTSIHTTTGFFEVVFGIYSFYGLKRYKLHKYHIGDFVRIGILFYILIILYRSMSPATDFMTMLMALMVISLWCDNMENDRSIEDYALLSVLAVYVLTMKFSACLLVLIVIYPAILLIKNRRWIDIFKFLVMGIVVVVPFLIRNIILSGYLLYPFDAIDIFNVEWKIPLSYLQHDAAQIKVWGRCLFDVELLDLPISGWLGPWIEYKDRHELMLLYGIVVGLIFDMVCAVRCFVAKCKFRFEYLCLMLGIISCLAVWFFEAPFIRYGLAFILTVILIPIGCFASDNRKGFYGILAGVLTFGCVACITPYFDNYITDMGLFIKHYYKDPYYISQKPYDDGSTSSLEINGNTIYYCDDYSEINSYYYFPNTCYYTMLERSTLIGNDIKDGFRAK